MVVKINKEQESLALIIRVSCCYVSQGKGRDGILWRRLITLMSPLRI